MKIALKIKSVHWYTQTDRYTDTQIHRYTDTDTQIHRYTDTDTQIHRHTLSFIYIDKDYFLMKRNKMLNNVILLHFLSFLNL